MKTIVIVGIEFNFADQPRIIQEINALHGKCRIIGFGLGNGLVKLDEFYSIQPPGGILNAILFKLIQLLKYYFPAILRFYYKNVLDVIRQINPDQIWVHHFESGVLVRKLNQKMIFNSHEYIPRQNDGSLGWRLTKQIMIKKEFPQILERSDVVLVESEAVKRDYGKYMPTVGDVVVVPNTRESHPEIPYREPKHIIRIAHHGIAAPSRGIEMMIDAVGNLKGTHTFHLYLVPSKRYKGYINKIRRYASKYDNIHMMEPIPYGMIVREMSLYDIGLCVFKSENYHTLYTTVPNKFWEYVTAGVVPVVWSKSAMAEIVETEQFGITCGELTSESLRDSIKKMTTQDIAALKKVLHEKKEAFSSENLVNPVVDKILKK